MTIPTELTDQEIAALKEATRLENDAEAVAAAARAFLRLRGLRELKAASGKVEFDADWPQWEELERGESCVPR